ncbi:MAG: DsbA family protein [bacterium]|nr:DsbA family protein [bacterium]
MKSETRFLLIMLGLVLFLGVGLAALNYYTRPPKPPAVQQTEIKLSDLLAPGRPEKGNPNAKVVIVEFTDLQCPSCRRGSEAVEQLMLQYEGKIRLICRHYPLDIHDRARLYAQAAEAAHRQGKFWEMKALIFSEQNVSPKRLEEFAQSLGLNMEQFRKDMKSPEVIQAVEEDLATGRRFGVSSTPTYFLFVGEKGQMVQGNTALVAEIQRVMEGE